jgi:hypothetical protein
MKVYPSIPGARGQQFREIANAVVFGKLDGSCMLSQWNAKRRFYKHGRRNGLLDDSNPQLERVPQLFEERLAEPLDRIARAQRWQSLIVYYEFWGAESLAGLHVEDDPKFLTVFDVEADGEMLGPVEFRKTFEDKVETAPYLGTMNWTRGLVETIRRGELPGLTFEGAVGKARERRSSEIVRAKAKTQAWIDRILQVHGVERGTQLVES